MPVSDSFTGDVEGLANPSSGFVKALHSVGAVAAVATPRTILRTFFGAVLATATPLAIRPVDRVGGIAAVASPAAIFSKGLHKTGSASAVGAPASTPTKALHLTPTGPTASTSVRARRAWLWTGALVATGTPSSSYGTARRPFVGSVAATATPRSSDSLGLIPRASATPRATVSRSVNQDRASDLAQLSQIVRNPGRLVMGPTSTSGSFPWGGIALGRHRDAELVWDVSYYKNRDPVSGAVNEISRRRVEVPELYALIEGPDWNADVIQGVFSRVLATGSEKSVTGASQGSVVAAWPPLLFVADDAVNGKSVYFPRPVSTVSDIQRSIAFSLSRKAGMPVRFTPTPPAGGLRPFQVARLANLVLA